MKQLSLVLFFSIFLQQNVSASGLPVYSTKFDPTRDAFADGRDAIKRAKATNRRILIGVNGVTSSINF